MSGGIGETKELRAFIAELTDRLDTASTSLQKATACLHQAGNGLAELRKHVDADVPEDIVIAISVAVSTHLDSRGKVKTIQYNRHKMWAA